jgi:hypothetical protein
VGVVEVRLVTSPGPQPDQDESGVSLTHGLGELTCAQGGVTLRMGAG